MRATMPAAARGWAGTRAEGAAGVAAGVADAASVDAAGFALPGEAPNGKEDHLAHYHRLYPFVMPKGFSCIRQVLASFAQGLSLRTARFVPQAFGMLVEKILRESQLKDIMEIVSTLAGFKVRREGPTRIGGRMGRPEKAVRTTCAYCGVGCSFEAEVKNEQVVRMVPSRDGRANRGHACVKGRFAYGYATHADRITTPMIRKQTTDPWQPVSWDEAFRYAASEFRRIQQQYGRESVGGITSSRSPSSRGGRGCRFRSSGRSTRSSAPAA